jgi:hypothetical protein
LKIDTIFNGVDTAIFPNELEALIYDVKFEQMTAVFEEDLRKDPESILQIFDYITKKDRNPTIPRYCSKLHSWVKEYQFEKMLAIPYIEGGGNEENEDVAGD